MHSKFPEPHITARTAAKMLGVTPKTLRNWRCDCKYLIPYIKKSNGHTLYSLLHIQEFLIDRNKYKRKIIKMELSF